MIRNANLMLSVSRNAGGLFDGVRRLLQSMSQAQMDVRVFGVRDQFTDADLPAWKPVTAFAFPSTGPSQFGYSPSFLSELTAYRPDLTHTHGIWGYPSMAVKNYCHRTRSPYVISPHGMLDGWAVRNSRWKKAIAFTLYEGAHLRGARCLRALCEAEARAIRQLRLTNDIAIIPNGVDHPTGNPSTPAPWAGSVESGRKILLFLGRIHPKKGLINLLRAWAEATPKGASGWVLAIAGWDQGGHEQELKQLATELGIAWTDSRSNAEPKSSAPRRPPSVVFLGPQFGDAKSACYHHSNGFILPSLSEGVPMVVLEAWVNSQPVLMTPECNLPEGFAAGAALKVDATPASLAAGLREFWQMTEADRASMGRNGYRLAAERFVWSRIAEQTKTLYEWVLGSGPRPSSLADF